MSFIKSFFENGAKDYGIYIERLKISRDKDFISNTWFSEREQGYMLEHSGDMNFLLINHQSCYLNEYLLKIL